jgi:hypothetical protein
VAGGDEDIQYTAKKILYRKFEQVFSEKKLRGLVPNFHINLSVRDLYIYPQDLSTYFAGKIGRPILEIGNENEQYHFWEYRNLIFFVV